MAGEGGLRLDGLFDPTACPEAGAILRRLVQARLRRAVQPTECCARELAQPVGRLVGTEPLRVALDLGPAFVGGAWRWGVRAAVRGATFYRLYAPEDFDEEVLRARALYANLLLLPLDGLGDATVRCERSEATVVVELDVG